MSKKLLLIPVFFYLFSFASFGQNELETISKEVWYPFYKAFATNDAAIFAEIHAQDLSRITGNSGTISSYEAYMERSRRSFERKKNNGQTTHISLRFFERSYNDNTACERGVYQTIHNKNKPDEHISYGQFFVLLKKVEGQWKIVLDYDSDENGTIGAEQFHAAHAIDDLKPFINK
jgi:hypothetical protein